MRERWSLPLILAGVIVAGAGIAERTLLYVRLLPTNSDEALSVLMARSIAHGHFPLFLWGQPYGGVVEAYPLSLLVRLFPTSLLADRALTLMLGALAAFLGGLLATRLAGPKAGLVTAAVLWLWPVFFVNWSMHEYLYYVPVICLGLAGMVWSIRTWQQPGSILMPVLVGLGGGLAFWMNPQMATFVPPIVVALLRVRNHRWRRGLLAGAASIVGAAPWVIYNLRHHLVSLDPGTLNQHASYLGRIHELIRDGGPVALGLETEGGTWLGGWAHPLYVVAIVVATMVVAAVVLSWRRAGGPPPIDLVGVLFYPFIYALSPAAPGYGNVIVRYFFFAWPWVALLTGRAVSVLPGLIAAADHRRSGNRRFLMAATSAVAVGVSFAIAGFAVEIVQGGQRATPPPGMSAAGFDFRVATASLEKHQTTRVLADYWLAYLFDTAANGAVLVTPSDPLDVRYEPWNAAVLAAPRPAWLFVPSSIKYRSFVGWLASEHIPSRHYAAAGFVVVVPTAHVVPAQVPVPVYRDPGENY